MADTTINVVTLEGARLGLSAGDTLAIMYPRILTQEQRAQITALCAESLPDGVNVAIFDGGVTIAAIRKGVDVPVVRRGLFARLLRSYADYRTRLGVVESARAAWLVSTHTPKVPPFRNPTC